MFTGFPLMLMHMCSNAPSLVSMANANALIIAKMLRYEQKRTHSDLLTAEFLVTGPTY